MFEYDKVHIVDVANDKVIYRLFWDRKYQMEIPANEITKRLLPELERLLLEKSDGR